MELDIPNYWGSGQVVLGAVIMVVNLMVIAQMNKYHLIGIILPLLSILVYFLIFYLMNLKLYKSDTLYGTFSYEMSEPLTYLGFFLVGGVLFSTENIFTIIEMIRNIGIQKIMPRTRSLQQRPVSSNHGLLEPLIPRQETKRFSQITGGYPLEEAE